MSLITNNISGSSANSSRIGITGSVIIADTSANFPELGSDVIFFVSGSTDGTKKAVFGGDVVVSGSSFLQGGSVEVTGTLIISGGLSGSLQSLADGAPYLVAGPNITINTGSNGSVEITGSAGTFDNFFDSTVSGAIFTSGSAAFVGSGDEWNLITSPSDKGADVFFYVSGSINSSGADDKKALFGGDVLVSGSSIFAGDVVEITGSLRVSGSVSVDGDVTVNGTITTINSNNLEIKDAIIGLGFASGTIAETADDRGIIGGISSGDNVAILWKNSEGEFSFGRTTSSATGSLPVTLTSYSNIHAANVQANIVTASLGFSGSLTTLANGDSYLVEGNNVTITSQSNGSVTISATPASPAGSVQFNDNGTFGGSSNFNFYSSSNELSLTGSLFVSGAASFDSELKTAGQVGSDVYFYVSGSAGSKDGEVPGVVVLGGDVVVSGTLYGGSPLKIGSNVALTGSLAVSGSSIFDDKGRTPAEIGNDVFFYVSGSINGGGADDKKSVFGGDVVVSGSLYYASTGLMSETFSGAGPFSASAVGFVLVSPGAATTILNLPSGMVTGYQMIVKRRDATPNAYVLEVSGSGGDTIDDSLGVKISTNYGAMTFVKMPGGWYVA